MSGYLMLITINTNAHAIPLKTCIRTQTPASALKPITVFEL